MTIYSLYWAYKWSHFNFHPQKVHILPFAPPANFTTATPMYMYKSKHRLLVLYEAELN